MAEMVHLLSYAALSSPQLRYPENILNKFMAPWCTLSAMCQAWFNGGNHAGTAHFLGTAVEKQDL